LFDRHAGEEHVIGAQIGAEICGRISANARTSGPSKTAVIAITGRVRQGELPHTPIPAANSSINTGIRNFRQCRPLAEMARILKSRHYVAGAFLVDSWEKWSDANLPPERLRCDNNRCHLVAKWYAILCSALWLRRP
jgi:hypothetical protein